MNDKAFAGAICALVLVAMVTMYRTRDQPPSEPGWPTIQQAWTWDTLPCLHEEQYTGEEDYRPCGKCSLQSRPVLRTRCTQRATIGPVFPRQCEAYSLWSGLYVLSPRECRAKLR